MMVLMTAEGVTRLRVMLMMLDDDDGANDDHQIALGADELSA
jgi:hypothetical protein